MAWAAVAPLLALLWLTRPWDARPRRPAPAASQDPRTCRGCHAEPYRLWASSHHAGANRLVDARKDTAILQGTGAAPGESSPFATGCDASGCWLSEQAAGTQARHALTMAIGCDPLVQYLSPFDRGRWQATSWAYHPQSKRWFDVFGSDGRQPGDWGHWTGQGMTWNSQCAYCHMTGFRKGYSPEGDSYRSSWQAQGVGCAACHAGLGGHAAAAAAGHRAVPTAQPAPRSSDRDLCLPCHSRREELNAEGFGPGDDFHDHYRLELPGPPDLFYADGQVQDEDFEGTSLLLSRMGGHAGVGCTDCHAPHASTLRAPIEGNQLCLGCHASGARGAPLIDPAAHSHHKGDSAGNRCVACHMPLTVYMQRDARRDHGFTSPDPMLTRELGIPNACNRCHADRSVAWAEVWAQTWYGVRLRWWGPQFDSRQRVRARGVAAAMQGKADAWVALRDLCASEEVPAWRASLAALLAPWATEPSVTALLASLRQDRDALVRDAVVRALAEHPSRLPLLAPLLRDPVRVVRIDAAYALRDELAAQPARWPPKLKNEVRAWLDQTADSPIGALRRNAWLQLETQSPP